MAQSFFPATAASGRAPVQSPALDERQVQVGLRSRGGSQAFGPGCRFRRPQFSARRELLFENAVDVLPLRSNADASCTRSRLVDEALSFSASATTSNKWAKSIREGT
jgi:hypothetical protein